MEGDRVVVDCSQPQTFAPDRVERMVTSAELGLEAMAAAFAGDSETAEEKFLAARAVDALPTVDEALESLPATRFEA